MIGLSAKVVKYNPYKPICQLKESANYVYCILEGTISVLVYKKHRYTKAFLDERKVNTLEEGQSFGEVGILYGKHRTASCIADCVVYLL